MVINMNSESQIREMLMDIDLNISSDLSWSKYKKQVNLLSQILPQNTKVLDLGCGYGHTAALLAVYRRDLEVTGIDIQVKASEWDILKKFGCKFHAGSALNIKNRGIDSIVSFGLMEHIDDEKFLKEVYRVLKPGGYNILFNLPNKYSLSEFFAKKLGIWYHKRRYTKGEVIKLLKENKFRILEIKRDDLIPSQVGRVSTSVGHIFNRFCSLFIKLDKCLNKTPLNFFAQSFTVVTRKI